MERGLELSTPEDMLHSGTSLFTRTRDSLALPLLILLEREVKESFVQREKHSNTGH
jgi:hypothetical protein